jgi:hypothetical protein
MTNETLYRVTYFSAHCKPQHFENQTKEQADYARELGKAQQYKVIITTMDEPQPERF